MFGEEAQAPRASLVIEPPVRCPACGARWKGQGPYCSQCKFRVGRVGQGPSSRVRAIGSEADELELDRNTATAFLARASLIGGFAATFVNGFAILGFLAVWFGCGLGLPGPKRTRWMGGFAVSAALLVLSVAVGTGVTAFTSNPTGDALNAGEPFLEVRIESWQYAQGQLIVSGTVNNTGSAPVFSPAIELVVYEDDSRDQVLATETAYPEGTFDAYLRQGQETSFAHDLIVPDAPLQVSWEILLNDTPGEVRGGPPQLSAETE